MRKFSGYWNIYVHRYLQLVASPGIPSRSLCSARCSSLALTGNWFSEWNHSRASLFASLRALRHEASFCPLLFRDAAHYVCVKWVHRLAWRQRRLWFRKQRLFGGQPHRSVPRHGGDGLVTTTTISLGSTSVEDSDNQLAASGIKN